MSLGVSGYLRVSITVCAVFRRGMHIAQTLCALRGGNGQTRVAQSRGLLTFYDPTYHSPLPAPTCSKILKYTVRWKYWNVVQNMSALRFGFVGSPEVARPPHYECKVNSFDPGGKCLRDTGDGFRLLSKIRQFFAAAISADN